MKLIPFLSLTSLAVAPFMASAAEKTFDVIGIFRGTRDNGNPIIEHEEIPGFMPAMTMAFNVKTLDEVALLEEGDQVRFIFHVDDSTSFADHFVVIGTDSSTQVKDSRPSQGVRLKPGDKLPEFDLVDENGKGIKASLLNDQATLITFIFTRCPVPEFCPTLALKYGALQAEIQNPEYRETGTPLQLLSITLDPEYDSPEILARYGKAVGADPKIWNFATGELEQIEKLAYSFGVKSERNGSSLDHTLTTALINQQGRIQKLWIGTRWNAEDVLREL